MGACEQKPDYNYLKNPEIRIYELREGALAKTTVYLQENLHSVQIVAFGNEYALTISTSEEITADIYLI